MADLEADAARAAANAELARCRRRLSTWGPAALLAIVIGVALSLSGGSDDEDEGSTGGEVVGLVLCLGGFAGGMVGLLDAGIYATRAGAALATGPVAGRVEAHVGTKNTFATLTPATGPSRRGVGVGISFKGWQPTEGGDPALLFGPDDSRFAIVVVPVGDELRAFGVRALRPAT